MGVVVAAWTWARWTGEQGGEKDEPLSQVKPLAREHIEARVEAMRMSNSRHERAKRAPQRMIDSPLRWVGGKKRLRRQIIALLPPHRTYV